MYVCVCVCVCLCLCVCIHCVCSVSKCTLVSVSVCLCISILMLVSVKEQQIYSLIYIQCRKDTQTQPHLHPIIIIHEGNIMKSSDQWIIMIMCFSTTTVSQLALPTRRHLTGSALM